jgi:hypothetical protein
MDTKKLLIIHPEGNINNNPNLSGIVEILCENGYYVDIISFKQPIYQFAPCANSKLFLIPNFFNYPFNRISSVQEITNLIIFLLRKISKRFIHYNLVIGVDREGVITASGISKLLKIPYGFISYEIFFELETNKKFKQIERIACKKLSFAVSQDKVRSCLLAEENEIPPEKIIDIPVAGRGLKTGHKNNYLYDTLGIPQNKKIALFAGSISERCMINELILSVNNWPEDWVLVLHNRYLLSDFEKNKLLSANKQKIFISTIPIPDFHDIFKLIQSADIGLVLNQPSYTSMNNGNNLKYLGFSSGKFSTYLQHGLPVIANDCGLINKCIREYHLGYSIYHLSEISNILSNGIPREYNEHCYSFFGKYLNLDNQIKPLLEKIDSIM